MEMQNQVLRKLFLGFIQLHILHHASEAPIYGAWMIEELKCHGYEISPGTLYPILHGMEKDGLLVKQEKTEGGKVRKYYSISNFGQQVLAAGKEKARELLAEID